MTYQHPGMTHRYSAGLLWTRDRPDVKTFIANTQNSQQRQLCHRRDSNPQYQQASGRKTAPYTGIRWRPLPAKQENNFILFVWRPDNCKTDWTKSAIGLTPGGSSTVQYSTVQCSTYLNTNNTQNNTKILEECVPCPVFAGFTLAFSLQLRKKDGKTSVRVAEECQLASWKYIKIQ